jgi:hypothetical protein
MTSARGWKEAAGGTQEAAAKLLFADFLNAVSKLEFRAFVHDVCCGDGFAQVLLGVGDPDDAVDHLVLAVARESRRTREQLARWAKLS